MSKKQSLSPCYSLFAAIFTTLSLRSKMNYSGSPNPNPNNFSCFADHNIDHHQYQSSEFELSDYLLFDDHHGFDEDSYSSQIMASSDEIIMDGSSSGVTSEKNNMQVTYIHILHIPTLFIYLFNFFFMIV